MTKKILLISLFFVSCKQEKQITNKKYFDLKGFSESIIAELEIKKPEVTKVWQIGNNKETKSTKDIDWAKELSLFVESDLNKRAFVNSYSIKETSKGVNYKLKPGESLLVKSMAIENLEEKNSKIISIETSTSNYLFKTNSKIMMKTKNGKLQEYSVYSIQKLFLSTPDTSSIDGRIINL
jgi:hypothetical protein